MANTKQITAQQGETFYHTFMNYDRKPRRKTASSRASHSATGGTGTRGAKKEPVQKPAVFLKGGIRIVHEDEHVVVVDKPTGILTASMPGDDLESVFRAVKIHVRERVKRRGTQVWIIHRLDKEASGLLVFAKTDIAFEALKEQFRAKRIHRIYSAVVEGDLGDKSSGTIQSFLVEDEEGKVQSGSAATAPAFRRRANIDQGPEGKLAVTHYQTFAAGEGRTFLHVRLETGRKNQIRVHMQEFGHPIAGDRKYGAKTDPADRVCLHATELMFTCPATGKDLRFVSPPPTAFFRLVDRRVNQSQTHEGFDWNAPLPPPIKVTLTSTPSPAANVQAPSQDSAQNMPQSPRPGAGGWEHVADWYSGLIEDRGSDHHDNLIIPGTVRLLSARPGQRILDVACGEGNLCRALASLGIQAVGVDASAKLIDQAKRYRVTSGPVPDFRVSDARTLSNDLGEFDGASCVMAAMNIEPLAPMLSGIYGHLRGGSPLVMIMLHPAFRTPGQTSWGWDDGSAKRDGPPGAERTNRRTPNQRTNHELRNPRPTLKQYRRVDGYLSNGQHSVIMNPGAASSGAAPVVTWTFHRPIQTYVRLLAENGFMIDALEEWPSLRTSQPGPNAAEENRSRKEIPMFLAIRARRL